MKSTLWSLTVLALVSAIAADNWCHNHDGQDLPNCINCCQEECNPYGVERCMSCCSTRGPSYCNGKEVAGGDCENPAD